MLQVLLERSLKEWTKLVKITLFAKQNYRGGEFNMVHSNCLKIYNYCEQKHWLSIVSYIKGVRPIYFVAETKETLYRN